MKKDSTPDQVTGYFISFSPDEMKFINENLEDFGYPPDISGVKKWIIDTLQDAIDDTPPETATDRVIRKAEKYLIDNPHIVRGVQAALHGIIKKRRAGR
jgi:hypothetical protein